MTIENGRTQAQLLGEVNVTPMIDILLVLLIIFMVISPTLPHGLQAMLPQRTTHPNVDPERPIVVQIIDAQNGLPHYKINQSDVSLEELGGRLSSIFAMRAEKVMFVKADDHLDFAAIAKVMDIGKGAGADHIGLLTSKDRL